MIDRKIIKKVLTKYGILTGDKVLYEHTVTQVYNLVNKKELAMDRKVLKTLSSSWKTAITMSEELNTKRKRYTFGEIKNSCIRLEKKHKKVQFLIHKGRRHWRKLA